MICEGCGQLRDELWMAGEDTEGRRIFVGSCCITEPSRVKIGAGA